MGESFLDDRVVLHSGNCLDVLARLGECSVDSCVTDPPYHLTSIVDRFSADNAAPPKEYSEYAHKGRNPYKRVSTGFMGKVWDGGDVAFRPEIWRAVYRVLKPGAHLVAMGGTRTFHRLACAIEDAGFEIRDTISWLYGSGFPKSHDVSKGIDRAAGAVRGTTYKPNNGNAVYGHGMGGGEWNAPSDPPATDAARQWQGWGTALKPACELIVLARKPLSEGTVAANVLKHGTGALNIDGCRIWADTDKTDTGCFVGESRENGSSNLSTSKSGKMPTEQFQTGLKSTIETETRGTTTSQICNSFPNTNTDNYTNGNTTLGKKTSRPDELQLNDLAINDGSILNGLSASVLEGEKNTIGSTAKGRWPANLAHDGSAEVTAAFPESNDGVAGKRSAQNGDVLQSGLGPYDSQWGGYGGGGSAARFFYTAKADADDRLGSKHPTVKPLDLMQWLVRLVTPRGGVCLDPFSGTGTTGEAAFREGMRAVLIEAEPEYQADIRRRMALALAGPDERNRESIKAKGLPVDYGPLFGFPEAAE